MSPEISGLTRIRAVDSEGNQPDEGPDTGKGTTGRLTPYKCFLCGARSDDPEYDHTLDECSVAQVLRS